MKTPLSIAMAIATTLGATAPRASTLWLFGEQHDQPDHQRQVAAEVAARARDGTLAALVVEMAERGRDTRGLAADASAQQVRGALAWSGWPWDTYAEVVMNAVRAQVPVVGGNLPRAAMRDAMQDASLDARVDDAVRARLADAVRDGHCGLLPETQVPGMVRIQIARDLALAAAATQALAAAPPGRDVVLLAGAQHVSRDRGVPLHLPAQTPLRVVMFGEPHDSLRGDEWRAAERTAVPDPCESLRQRLRVPRR